MIFSPPCGVEIINGSFIKKKKKKKEIINGSFLMVWRLGVPPPPPPPRKVIELQCIWDKGVLEAIYVRICENLFPMFNVVHLE